MPKTSSLFALFEKAVPPEFFDQLQQRLGLPAPGIYSLAVVVWLMMWQRLDGQGTLVAAVHQAVQEALGDLLPPEKQVREETVSSNTGALSRARKRLPLHVVKEICDQIFGYLMKAVGMTTWLDDLFLIDGSSMRLAHTAALIKAYPLASNPNGEAHWPVIRVLVAHHLSSGLAARPCWGPMHGTEAVSEQGLIEQMMDRLPARAVLMADRNFAVFSVAWAAQQHPHRVVFRITEERARRIAGQILPTAGTERRIEWQPSRDDRRAHPEIPADAVVRGRLIVAHIKGEDGERLKLFLFTTLEEPREILVDVYAQRWHIELDTRSLKQTLGMQSVSAKTPEMVEKELLLGIAGYNLVRSVQMAAARQANLQPRQLSFSRVQAVIMTAVPDLATITDPAEWEKKYQQVLRWAAQGKLPNRSRRRSYPRETWGQGGSFPRRKCKVPSPSNDQKGTGE